jgi:hypothetical protein
VVSGLVLNFVADQAQAMAEMARVSASGETFAAYVWDYAGKMELMRHFWDAADRTGSCGGAIGRRPAFPLVPARSPVVPILRARIRGGRAGTGSSNTPTPNAPASTPRV